MIIPTALIPKILHGFLHTISIRMKIIVVHSNEYNLVAIARNTNRWHGRGEMRAIDILADGVKRMIEPASEAKSVLTADFESEYKCWHKFLHK